MRTIHVCRRVSSSKRACSRDWRREFRDRNLPEVDVALQLFRAEAKRHKDPALFDRLCEKRLTGMPIQYCLGSWDFCSLSDILVRPPVLIPRPETEELVRLVQQHMSPTDCRILDVGTGSGAIAAALLHENKSLHAMCIDVSPAAVQLASDNMELFDLSDRAQVKKCSIEEFGGIYDGFQFDVLVSNPPYIPSSVVDALEDQVLHYEDRGALDGGTDGFSVTRQILRHCSRLVRPGGKVLMELDDGQPTVLCNSETDLFAHMEAVTDMYEKDRFFVGMLPTNSN
ncbi:MAG: hypothetical protein MHM6MM_003314 [Cercozoa sp. M6MM]